MFKKENFKNTLVFTLCSLLFLSQISICYYVWINVYNHMLPKQYGFKGNMLMLMIYGFLLILFNNIYGGYKVGYYKPMNIILSGILSTIITNFISYFQICLMCGKIIVFKPFIFILVTQCAMVIIWGLLSSRIYFKLYPPKKMLLIYGKKESTLQFVNKFIQRADKYMICESINIESDLNEVFEKIDKYESVVLSDIRAEKRNILLKYCFEKNISVYLTTKISDILVRSGKENNLFDTPIVYCENRGLTPMQKFVKRAMDLMISSVGIVLSSPLMLLTAIAIKIEDGGPIFFKQKRCTIDNKEFNVIKFRSMIVDAEKDGKSHPCENNDPRITKVGNFIRKTRLDELPQLFNIFEGSMSVVGPRPERIEHVIKYTEETPEFVYRTKVKGGLTGYAQIFGKYNTTAYDKLKLDLVYIQNYSILLDIKLILMTIKIMFMKESTEGFEKAKVSKKML